jgi:hypothetical protein
MDTKRSRPVRYPDPDLIARNARQLRREELARIAHAAGIKWSTFWKSTHAPHPRQIPSPPHA